MFTELKHIIVPVSVFLTDFQDRYRRSINRIDKRYPNWDINYLEEFKDNPSSIWNKFNEPDCYISMVFNNNEIIAFSMTYGYDTGSCILGSRSYVVNNSGFEAVGLLSAYCIPSQMIEQRKKYKIGLTTFNINSYSDRLWTAHCRTFSRNWNKHKKTVNTIFPDYDYLKAQPQSSTRIINSIEQRYSITIL